MTQDRDTDMIAILNDIRSYTRMSAAASSKPTASKILDSYEKALVYTKLDGKTSQQKISDSTSVPQKTVSNWADEFVKMNLAAPPDEFNPSHKALFSLSELSIELSALKKRKKQEESQQKGTPSTLDSAPNQTEGGGTTE